MTNNQNPEQRARDIIDQMLIATGWVVQLKPSIVKLFISKHLLNNFLSLYHTTH